MKTTTKVILTALGPTLGALNLNPAAPLGKILWGPMPDHGVRPTGAQLAFLMPVVLLEALAFGIGIAFLVHGRKAVFRVAPSRRLAWAAYLGTAWALVSGSRTARCTPPTART